jgi:voltage-dependent calcium channel L type alpha-1D
MIGNRCRRALYYFTINKYFEFFIIACIMLNTIVLAINWYSQPIFVDDILDYINYFFAVVFALECILKIIALGPKIYFTDTGNAFDFFIVITTIVSTVVSIYLDLDFGASTTFIRALRISRVFKFIRLAKQLKIMFETLVVTIPSLTNVGGLLLLFLYMFSVLGVFLFAEVKLQENLNIYANF